MSSLQSAISKKTLKGLVPFRCVFELTYRCNLSCVHCYCANNSKTELKKEEIFRILEELKDAGCLYLVFTGGEIFTRNDLFDIVEKARNLNFVLRLFTNCTLIDGVAASRLKSLKPLSVETSLYGLSNTHDRITRVKGSFDKTVHAIRVLRKSGVRVVAKMILMRENADEVWRLKKFALEGLKVEWRGLGGSYLISPCDDGGAGPLLHRLTNNQLEKYIRESAFVNQEVKKFYQLRKINKDDILCRAGITQCNVTPQGNLNPCIQIRLRNNSLKNKSFTEIWRGHPDICKIRELRVSDKKDCLDCKIASYCFACPGLALLETGSLTAKLPEACRHAKIRKEVYEDIAGCKC